MSCLAIQVPATSQLDKNWRGMYSKTCLKRPPSKRPKIVFQYQLPLNAGHKYCRMLQGEHSAILLAFIKLPFVIKIFVLSILEWPFKTGFTVVHKIPIIKLTYLLTYIPESYHSLAVLS